MATMRTARRSGIPSAYLGRTSSTRIQGRITKEDVRSAGLRRWNGRARITTDWVNLYHDSELCFSDGDLLIYLREPGQSSRGPAFRVHRSRLREKSLDVLLEKCISRPPLHSNTKCLMASCHGCAKHAPPAELYIPAPSGSDLKTTFDHHITTRNLFAWLYDLPLAGRALGKSLVNLMERINYYRPNTSATTAHEIVMFADAQRYLDFRECVDHALAALLLAETLQLEDLWIDAFAHCVGMSHRGISSSLEYPGVSYDTRVLISDAQLEMETIVERVRRSVSNFFEGDLSGSFLGLSQLARDHLDCFRSWLHSHHIEQHGFWPPASFADEAGQRSLYSSMYSDFKNLYHHLVDLDSSSNMMEVASSGGVCTMQNVQAFDARYRYQSLPKPLPMLPREPDTDTKPGGMQRRKSWNPITRRRVDKDRKKQLRVQALITASNRDWAIMDCLLVRRYSEFESQNVVDESEVISMVDGRKVRWILIYSILQTLISVMQTPQQVRNADGLTYLLCCRPPKVLPWQNNMSSKSTPDLLNRRSTLEPDTNYLHSSTSNTDLTSSKMNRSSSKQIKQARRQSLPARVSSVNSRPSTARSSSIRNFISRRNSLIEEQAPPMPKSPSFCEILVQGYGNGLNEIEKVTTGSDEDATDDQKEDTSQVPTPTAIVTDFNQPKLVSEPTSAVSEKTSQLTPVSSASVSRESSNASSSSNWSKTSSGSQSDTAPTIKTPVQVHSVMALQSLSDMTLTKEFIFNVEERPPSEGLNHVLDEEGLIQTAHFNTETWDALLEVVS